MDCSAKLWHLENFNLMSELSMREKMRMSELITDKSFDKGQTVFFPGDPARNIYFLKKGKVKISSTSETGKEMIVSVLGQGEIFGELAVTGLLERDQTAIATEHAIICSMAISDFEKMIESNPKLGLHITKLIGLRLKKIQNRLESLCFKSAPERVRQFIKTLVKEHGRKIGDEYEVKLKLTHQDIANLTATTRQTVTLVLRDLEKKDVILYDRSRILLRNINLI